jgi:DNA polymerase-3 subunit delta
VTAAAGGRPGGRTARRPGGTAALLASAAERPLSAYLVRGDDPALVADGVRRLLGALTAGRDPSTVVEEHGGAAGDELDVGQVVDAVTTPPFLTDRRVVVVRDAGRLAASAAERLAGCLAEALPGVVLVLAAGAGTVPKALVQAVQHAGGVIDTTAGTGRARTEWITERLHDAPVRFDARAGALLAEHLGQDLHRLPGLVELVTATYGPGAAIGPAELAPLLGEAGGVAPWELTDAIAAGRSAEALALLARLLGPAGMYPLAVLNTLARHYQTMLRLDGASVSSPEEAAARLGARSVYPVKKALEEGRRLGPARIGRAVVLLADADLDLRGRSALPEETVPQVLVARLARLGGTRPSGRRAAATSG